MAIDPFGRLLETEIRMDEIERQRRLDAAAQQQNELANRLAQQRMQQSFRPKAFQPQLFQGPEGGMQYMLPTFYPNTGAAGLQPLQAPEGFSPYFQTPEAKAGVEVQKKRDILAAETEAAQEKEKRKVTGKTIAESLGERVKTGREAISAIPIIKRSLDLLNTVETGGPDAWKLKAKQFLGVESADEAELAQNLGKAVLKQLKPTFGAQFTVAEGRELKGIEAAMGKSTAGNKRLLNRALAIYERATKRGMEAAKEQGDMQTYKELEQGLSYQFTEPVAQTQKQIVRRGKYQGRNVIEYSDGTVEYAD